MNYKNENLIKWEKWIDPFSGEDETSINNVFDDDDDDNNDDDKSINSQLPSITKQKQIRVIATPMGIVPINEHTASGKIFNFWVGHTNFNITKFIAQIIEETDGVESLDIFTRYRFRISIGKAFVDSVVMRDINSQIYEFLDAYEDQP